MKTNLILILFMLLVSINAKAQNTANQYIVYVQSGTTPAELQSVAALFNSVVVTPPVTGGNLALLEVNYFPFPDPHLPGVNILNINSVLSPCCGTSKIPDEDEIDGGTINYPTDYFSDSGRKGQTCPYDETKIAVRKLSNPVKLALIDTGVEYKDAQNLGYHFANVEEINGPVPDAHGHGTHLGTLVDDIYHQNSNENPLSYAISNVFGSTGNANLAEVLFDIETALLSGSQIINCSFSYPILYGGIDAFELLIESPQGSNALFVVSAGNSGVNIDDSQYTFYPVGFDSENILSVASYRNCNTPSLSGFSNYGQFSVDIAAPGEYIKSRNNMMELVVMSGTSQSTATVSAIAALLGTYLQDFDPILIKCAIMSGAEVHPNLDNYVLSSGILDGPAALEYLFSNCQSMNEPARREHINVNAYSKNLNISPNPVTNDELNISFELNQASSVLIEIINANGAMIQKIEFDGKIGSNEILIDLNKSQLGNFFFVKTTSKEETIINKILNLN